MEEGKFATVEQLKVGEYVKRKPEAHAVFKRGEYDRTTKRYSLIDCEDVNRVVYVKRGTELFYDFTY